nr:SagB/ThcOx family dehydrogenase [Anaerolineae bacterium]
MTDTGKTFLRLTTYPYLEESDQSKGLPQPPLVETPDPSWSVIDLPAPDALSVPDVMLRKLIEDRRTLRSYTNTPLTPEELSYLLWCTQGVKEITRRPATLRTVPSAGARHAFETYLLINNVTGFAPGLYFFIADQHKLALVSSEADIADRITAAALSQDQVKTSAVTFIWLAVAYRMTWRYTERGYRYLFMDAGHVGQNLCLAAESIDCGVCPIGAYLDDEINEMLNADGENRFVIYMGTVGKRS